MNRLVRLLTRVRRQLLQLSFTVWYSPGFRLPLAALEGISGMEPRRADYVVWYLLDRHVITPDQLRTPSPIPYSFLARVHTTEYLESLSRAETLANIFAATPGEVPVDQVLHTVRLGAGATLGATRETLRTRVPALTLLGGFHHAKPSRGVGFCAVNDIATAIAAVRAEGFQGRVCVLDLDAHPPDGTAECLKDDPQTWIGSLSGTDWGELPRVDEVHLTGVGDAGYLAALTKLLKRMPKPDLVFVVAGGDVLAGDRNGGLALTLDGARQRDLQVARASSNIPSVWVPAGGYNRDAWRVLAGTALALGLRTRSAISQRYDPMTARFALIASGLDPKQLGAAEEEDDDIRAVLGLRRPPSHRLLGFYTAEGMEYALDRYGILGQLERLGYRDFHGEIDEVAQGDRFRLFGHANGRDHVLVECVLEKQRIDDKDVLYIHWLELRHPIAIFNDQRPALPGQSAPGLGLAREVGQLLARLAERLGLAGVAFRPSWFHTAYSARYHFRFAEPARQDRFAALIRDLGDRPLLEITKALAEGRVRMNDEPYTWEADAMVYWLGEPARPKVEPATGEWHFTMA